LLGAALLATPALAADPPVAAAPPADGTDTPPPAPPPPAPAPAPAPKEAAPPPAATETMPATRPDARPPIQVGAWTRVGALVQGADRSKLNDVALDNAYVELHAGGKIHKNVGVTLNLNANGVAPGLGGSPVAIMDAIISFDPMDELHIWAGRLLVPVDRSNFSGPFFMIPWNYPGFFAGPPGSPGASAPKEGPYGRNNGAVVWGDINGGQFSYFAGAFDNISGNTSSPLFSGRLRLALLDKEPGFWGNGSYFGEKNLLTIGVGGQFQKHGSASMTEDKDWADINADVLFEKKLGGGAWFTAEGAFYHYNVLPGAISDTGYALVAYATPPVGPGNIQPMARYQFAKVKDSSADMPWNIDVGLSYLIKGPALRLVATYGHTKLGPFAPVGGSDSVNSVQLGAQAIFF
jgi:hypothetical protein